MWLWLMPASIVKAEWCREPGLKAMAEANGGEIECLGTIRMWTADKKILTGWLASQTDMLSEDWEVLVEPMEEAKPADADLDEALPPRTCAEGEACDSCQ